MCAKCVYAYVYVRIPCGQTVIYIYNLPWSTFHSKEEKQKPLNSALCRE